MKIKLLIFLVLLISCQQKSRSLVITDPNISHSIILKPNKNGTYTSYSVKVTGFSSDTCYVYIQSRKSVPLIGEIDFTESYDYYGQQDFEVKIDPYNANNIDLFVEASIQ